jgi:hypothetical protein
MVPRRTVFSHLNRTRPKMTKRAKVRRQMPAIRRGDVERRVGEHVEAT